MGWVFAWVLEWAWKWVFSSALASEWKWASVMACGATGPARSRDRGSKTAHRR